MQLGGHLEFTGCLPEVQFNCYQCEVLMLSPQQVVFSLFVTQLQGLEKPSALSFRSSFHLLECLATTKAFNLCLSLDSQDLLADLFKMMFAIVK